MDHRFSELQKVKDAADDKDMTERLMTRIFQFAAKRGHLDIVKYILEESKFSIDLADRNNYAFRWASTNGHIEVVKFLLPLLDRELGFDIKEAIRNIAHSGNLQAMKELYATSSDADDFSEVKSAAFAKDAAKTAASRGHTNIVEYFHEKHPEIFDVRPYSRSILAEAISFESVETTRYILENSEPEALLQVKSHLIHDFLFQAQTYFPILKELLMPGKLLENVTQEEDQVTRLINGSGAERAREILREVDPHINLSANSHAILRNAIIMDDIEMLQLLLHEEQYIDIRDIPEVHSQLFDRGQFASQTFLLTETLLPFTLEHYAQFENARGKAAEPYKALALAEEFITQLCQENEVTDTFLKAIRLQLLSSTPLQKLVEHDLHSSLSVDQLEELAKCTLDGESAENARASTTRRV